MTILIFILVLLLLIVGHEFGHFTAAKWVKMKVLEFGVGFPPKIFGKKFSPDGTEYTVNWLPFGGFVRIFGEDEKDITDPLAFPNRPKLHQAFVLFAGPFANLVLAVVLLTGALSLGALSVVDDASAPHLVGEPKVLVGGVLPGSPAEKAGIQTGDEILGVDTPEAFAAMIAESDGAVTIMINRNQEEKEVMVTPEKGLVQSDPERKAIGVATALFGKVAYPLPVAFWKAIVKTGEDFVFIVVSLVSLIASAFTLSADVSQIAGPVGIASLTGDAARLGVGALLSFAALLSVNLAVINLLPFPALDGGRLFFLGIESLFRKKIPLAAARVVNLTGFAVLILLMLAVTAQDIFRLFS